ncbi:MAG TPA: gamma-glutamyltransferase, partial [Thermomicrobiales bacterium]|nr:gamma-glutamyltransferase [Thermomicrobiales bacterium]
MTVLGFPGAASIEPAWERRRKAPAFAEGGMVAAAHPLTTMAGVAALEQGGNAVDAAVAAALVASVVMPEMCGLGGDLFAIVHAPGANGTKGDMVAVHGSGIAPRGATIEQMRAAGDAPGQMPYQGPLSVGVPGMVDAYFSLLKRFGTRTFAELAERAITYAENGFPLTHDGARSIADNRSVLERFPSSAAVFFPGGESPREGAVLRQSDLGRTLRQIAAGGRDVFYEGDIAKRIAAFMAANGGAITVDDLSDHTTEFAPPLETTYRNYTVYETCLPTQGLILLESLNIAEQTDLRTVDPYSAEGIHLLAETKKLAFADRVGYAADPTFVTCPLDTLLSKEWARERAKEIDPNRASAEVPAGIHREGDTTYLCAIDGNGMMVSLIQSVSSAFGSGVVAGDTGIVLNNRVGRGFSLQERHPNIFAPGKKTMHTLNCYLIADPDGTPILVGGTPGGDGQPQWNLQVISGLIDAGLDVQAALEAPRWTSWPGTDPSTIDNPFELRIEDRFGDAIAQGLADRGHDVHR